MKIYENNVLLRNYIPVLNVNNHRLGLYDTINEVFYSNSGTGEFNTDYITGGSYVSDISNQTLYAIWEDN